MEGQEYLEWSYRLKPFKRKEWDIGLCAKMIEILKNIFGNYSSE